MTEKLLFISDVPFPKIGDDFQNYTLPYDLILPTGEKIFKNATVKLKQTRNFGWVVYNSNNGKRKKLFKW